MFWSTADSSAFSAKLRRRVCVCALLAHDAIWRENWVMDKTHNKKIRNLSFEKKNSKIWHVGYLRHIKKVSMCFVLHVYISCFTYSFISNACGRWTFMNDFQKEKNPFQIKCSNFNSVEFLGAERMPAQALESLFYSLLHICFYILFIDSFLFMFCFFNV